MCPDIKLFEFSISDWRKEKGVMSREERNLSQYTQKYLRHKIMSLLEFRVNFFMYSQLLTIYKYQVQTTVPGGWSIVFQGEVLVVIMCDQNLISNSNTNKTI